LPSIASTVTESSVRVRDQRQCPGAVDRHPGSLFAGLDRADLRGWRRGEVDHIDLVIRYALPAFAVFDPVERIGDQRQVLIGRNGEVYGRPDDRVHQRKVGDDPRFDGVADVDDRHRILAGRPVDGLGGLVKRDLLVVAGDQ
jgi:hypothetical protein